MAGQSREVAAAIIRGRRDGSWAPRVGKGGGNGKKRSDSGCILS